MKPILFALSAILFFFSLDSMACYPEGLTLNTNQEVADFAVNNPACTIIEGDLTIGDGVTSLAGLSMITEVVGMIIFNVETSPITSLEGLNALTSVGGLNLPWGLSDLNGLSSLTHIGGIYIYDEQMAIPGFEAYTNQIITAGGIYFQNTSFAPDFTGFSNLETVTQIEINEGCEHIAGFDNLWSIGVLDILASTLQTMPDFLSLSTLGDFNYIPFSGGQLQHLPSLGNTSSAGSITIRNAEMLTDLSGFESLQTVSGITLQTNFGITSLNGLQNITSADNIQLFDLQNLTDMLPLSGCVNMLNLQMDILPLVESLSGLENLQTLSSLSITSNYALSDISALNGISGLQAVLISDNPLLETCSVGWLCAYISEYPGQVSLAANGPGCNTQEEIVLGCGNDISSMEGLIYYDADCDGMMNNADVTLPNAILFTDNGFPFVAADANGFYTADILLNAAYSFNTGSIEGTETAFFSITTNEMPGVYMQDVGVCPTPVVHDLRVIITPANVPVPGFTTTYYVHAINLGNAQEEVVLTFTNELMPGYTIISPEDVDGVVTWNFSLNPLESNQYLVQGSISPTVPLGTNYFPQATIGFQDETIVDEFFLNNVFAFKETIVGSYDPNDKTVSPSEINYETVENGETTVLDYVIRFQNTGTYPATFISVVDTIDTNVLDISTLQMVAASHSYALSFDENEITWFFDNIQLPDSTSNEPESHGYIHFRMRTKEGLLPADVIDNKVAIYFDFNAPIITNTAQTIFYECPESLEILAPPVLCAESEMEFSASVSGMDSYTWLLDGAEMGSEETLLLQEVSTGDHSLELSITYFTCSLADVSELFINPLPLISINSGDTVFCEEGQISALSNSDINWTLNGENISGNAEITLNETGTYYATATNVCGSDSDSISVTVVDMPESIELMMGDVMMMPSVEGLTYAWYLNGELIDGETEATLFPGLPGDYTVEVFFGNGCSMLSTVLTVSKVEEYSASSYSLAPNPAKDVTRLQVNGNISASTLVLKDITGRTVQTSSFNTRQMAIDCSQLPSGIYFLLISKNGKIDETMRLVVE